MTRTAINKSCKQFNKICFCYPTVNTSWYPSTPHKGTDGDIRPLKPPLGILRQIGNRLVVYLDNILILHQSREELECLAPQICSLFEALGLVINTKKSILIPQQVTEFLGFQIDSVTLQIQMPQEKLRKIQHNARWLLQHQSITVRDLARFMGKTTASSKAIWQAPLHYRGIQALMNSVLPETEDNSGLTSRFNVKLPLSVELPFELLLTDVLLLELLLTDAMATDNPDSPNSPSACFDHKHYHYVFSQALSPCKNSAKSFMSGKVIAEQLYFFECICGKDVYICM